MIEAWHFGRVFAFQLADPGSKCGKSCNASLSLIETSKALDV